MSSLIKPNLFSLLLHLSVLSALYCIPATAIKERFTSDGQRNVVAIEVTLGAEPAADMDATPATVEVELADHELIAQAVDARDFDKVIERREPSRLLNQPRLMRTTFATNETNVRPTTLKRRHRTEREMPAADATKHRVRPKPVRPSAPPAIVTPPIEALAGLKESTQVRFTHNPPPSYPADAVRLKKEGVVLLELTITKLGKVASVTVVKSSGHVSLDDAALAAVTKWHGDPAKKWGRPIESVERLPIRFRL